MKKIRFILLLVMCMVAMTSCHTDNTDQPEHQYNIAVLVPYGKGTQIMDKLQNYLNEEFPDSLHYRIRLMQADDKQWTYSAKREYFHNSVNQLESCLKSLRQQSIEPDLFILFSDQIAMSAAMLPDSDVLIHTKPVLCLDITDAGWPGPDSVRMGDTPLLRRQKNFVVMESRPAVKENLDFIRDLGNPSWVVTDIDSTYLDDNLRASIMAQIGRDTAHYMPNLHLEQISQWIPLENRDSVRTTLIPLSFQHPHLNHPDSLHHKGFNLAYMLRIKDRNVSYLRIKDDCYADNSLSYNLGVYYTATAQNFNLHDISGLCSCLGGYFTRWNDMLHEVHPMVDNLLAGTDPASIPWGQFERKYWLDWRLATQVHFYAEDFPSYVNFINLPWRLKSRLNDELYRYWLPLSIAIFALLLLIIPTILAVKQIKQHKKLLKQAQRATLLDHQMEDIMKASHAYYWRILPNSLIEWQTNSIQALGINSSIVPIENVINAAIPEDREKARQELKLLKENSTKQMEVEVKHTGDGSMHHVVLYINHVYKDGGEPLCYGIMLVNDQAHQGEIERQEAYRRSEETKVKESFLASLSHEIRNPLNAIVGFSELLVKQFDSLSDEERAMYDKYIMQGNDQLITILDNVMKHSQEDGDALQIQLSRKNVADIMEEIYVTHSVVVPKHLSFDFQKGPDAMIKVNRVSLIQIMSNIINNAIKFTKEGGITFGWEVEEPELSAENSASEVENPASEAEKPASEAEDAGTVVLFVEDTGIGIPEQNQQNIFKKFYKEDNFTVGAGIGLPLCMQLARSMQGDIKVKSTLGKGSRFEVRFPKLK